MFEYILHVLEDHDEFLDTMIQVYEKGLQENNDEKIKRLLLREIDRARGDKVRNELAQKFVREKQDDYLFLNPSRPDTMGE